jgi:DNA-binding transcriptional regulator GbsR (MarR family)
MLLVNKIISLFETEWRDISIVKIRYFARENEIHMTLTSGTHVLLTLEAETSAQDYTSRVNSIKNQLIGLSTYIDKYKAALTDGQMTYVDARIVKKIFTCKTKDVCTTNLVRIYGDTYK